MAMDIMPDYTAPAKLRVVGIGGGGNNALNNMIDAGLQGVEFIAANTDMQALERSKAAVQLQLGSTVTRGLGAGSDPEVGRQAALEDRERIKDLLSGSDMVFVTAGLGGGTGTGGAPVVAEVAKESGALTVAVVTKPFDFEGRRRMSQAEWGVDELKKVVDTLIIIPNTRLRSLAGKNARFADMLKTADEVLLYAVRGISDLIITPGLINLDFADVRTVMGEMGVALMGTGEASGENRAFEASTFIQEAAHEDANIIFGTVIDEAMGESIRVTVIATGIGVMEKKRTIRRVVGGADVDISTMDHVDIAPYRRSVGADAPETRRPERRRFAAADAVDLDVPTFLRRQAD